MKLTTFYSRLFFWLLTILWMAFIFFLSARSTVGIGQTEVSRFLILKFFHLVEYFMLYILIRLASGSSKTALILTYLYAVSDELHQIFVPGREGKWLDTLIDFVGTLIGLTFHRLILTRFRFLRSL
ncbi:MAG: VanZ family protein [Candidatus Shapirobacteria bacterium]